MDVLIGHRGDKVSGITRKLNIVRGLCHFYSNIVTLKNILFNFELLSYRSNPLLWIDHVGSCIR